MDETIKLSDIFIGKADGLAEAKRRDFTALFYNGNKNYNLLKDDESKFIISGRKGTGKTILAKYYEKEMQKEECLVKFVNGNDILLRHIKEVGAEELDDRYIPSFIKYIILSEIATMLIDNKKKIIKKFGLLERKAVKKIYKSLEKIVLQRRYQSNYRISDFSKQIEEELSTELSDEKIGSKLNSKIGSIRTENYTRNNYFETIDRMERIVLFIMRQARVAIILDDIDEYAEKLEEDTKFKLFLIKLIEIIYELNEDIHQNTKTENKIILLLRSDIIDKLQSISCNINKIIVDSQILLNWIGKIDVNNPEHNLLLDLILTKIKNSHQSLKGLNTREVYEKFFPNKINGVDTIKYIFRRSHGRPRDVVNLLNIIRRDNPDASSFEERFFLAAEKEYSRIFKDELKNEASLTYNSDKINYCFRLVTLIGKTVFTMEDVNAAVSECKKHDNLNIESKDFIDTMYEIGAIGNYRDINGRKVYLFKYREDGCEEPDYRYKFVVHQGLRKHLLRV